MNSTESFVLGIETSCDDTSIALIQFRGKEHQIIKHISFDQQSHLLEWGGVVPEIAARNHLEKIPVILKSILCEFDLSKLDLIGVTSSPGLLGPLLTGINAAKTLSLIHKTPIVPINHLYAHLEAIHLSENISYPYLGLLVSGGHSLFCIVHSSENFQVIGSTIDDAAGEAFDKGAKLLGLGYPGGQLIDQMSKQADSKEIDFPIGLKSSADCRLSFSGLKTALKLYLDKNPDLLKLKPKDLSQTDESAQLYYNVCASYQEAICQSIKLKMRYAIKQFKQICQVKKVPIIVGGGVACNSRLRKVLQDNYQDVHFVKPQFCTDNGAMIAHLAYLNKDKALNYPDSLHFDGKSRVVNKKDFV